jgi:hypothetical protein
MKSGRLVASCVGLMIAATVFGTATIANEPTATASRTTGQWSQHAHYQQAPSSWAPAPWKSPTTPTAAANVTTTTVKPTPAATLPTSPPPTTTTTSAPPAVVPTTTVSPTPTPTPTSTSSSEPSGLAMPGAIAGWAQTFADDFTSPASLDHYDIYGGTPGDGSDSCWDGNHVVVSGSELVLKGYKDPAAIAANACVGDANQIVTGGVKLATNSQLYGKYEVRMRVDNGQGVSAVALLWPTTNTWPPEIDFTEDNGGSPRTVDTATEHWGTYPNVFGASNTLPVNLSQWHTVGVEWSPGKIVYTMDGSPWATETNANVPNVPMQLALQTEAWQCGTSTWEECANTSTPAEVDMDVDWIVAYAPAGRTRALDHLAPVPAAMMKSPSLLLLALITGIIVVGTLLLVSKRRRRQVRRIDVHITT